MNGLKDKVPEWIERHGLFEGVSRVLQAVSGGADSIAMVHILKTLRREGRLRVSFAIGHVNHQLRGEASDGDEAFVRDLAGQLGIDVFCARVDVLTYAKEHRLSVETAGRILRRRELIRMAREAGCGAVATAHHADDQAETLVHRLVRGTGYRGLAGIRPVIKLEGMRFVRPMLGVRREAIVDYLRGHRFGWREDHTNADTQMTRNRIRHVLLPELEAQAQGDLTEAMGRLARRADALRERIDKQADVVLRETVTVRTEGRIEMELAGLAACSSAVLGEVLRQCLTELGIGLRDYTQRHYEQMESLIAAGKRTAVHLPGGAEMLIRRGRVIFKSRV